MKKLLPVLPLLFSTQVLAEITIEEYPGTLAGHWLEDAKPVSTKLTFFKAPQAIQIKSDDCLASGTYKLQIAVDIPEKSECWKYECFQMDITITETQGGETCSAHYPPNQPFFVNMRLQDQQTLLFGEDLIFRKQ